MASKGQTVAIPQKREMIRKPVCGKWQREVRASKTLDCQPTILQRNRRIER